MDKIPVTIVSGFLGAGKTTLLNHLLAGEHGVRIAVLVNDFGSIDVDSSLIQNVHGTTIGLANGCVCCTIRDDLVQALVELLARDFVPDHIVIETSGVSDPAAAAMAVVMSTRLASRLRLDAIVTVVDAENLLGLAGEHQALATDQIQAADIVLVNKRDLVSAETLDRVQSWIRASAPRVRILVTAQCAVPLEILFDTAPLARAARERAPAEVTTATTGTGHGHGRGHGHAAVHDVTTWSWHEATPVALGPLYELLQRLPTEVFRAKGHLNLAEVPDRRVVLQVVGKRIQLSKGSSWAPGEEPASRVVMLALGHESQFGAVAADLGRCLDNSTSPPNRFVEAVVNILRGPSDPTEADVPPR